VGWDLREDGDFVTTHLLKIMARTVLDMIFQLENVKSKTVQNVRLDGYLSINDATTSLKIRRI